MTLEGAIKHLEETLAGPGHDWGCEECKAEHEQLLEWLTELKNRREVSEIEKRSIEKCDKCLDVSDCPLFYPWLKE